MNNLILASFMNPYFKLTDHYAKMIVDIENDNKNQMPFTRARHFYSHFLLDYPLRYQPFNPLYKNKFPENYHFYYDDILERVTVDNIDKSEFYEEEEEERINNILTYLLKYHPYSNYWHVDELLKEIKLRRKLLLHFMVVTTKRCSCYEFQHKNYYYKRDDDGDELCFYKT